MQIKKGSIIKNKLGATGLVVSVDENVIVVKYLISGNDNKNVGATFELISNEDLIKSLNNKELELINET